MKYCSEQYTQRRRYRRPPISAITKERERPLSSSHPACLMCQKVVRPVHERREGQGNRLRQDLARSGNSEDRGLASFEEAGNVELMTRPGGIPLAAKLSQLCPVVTIIQNFVIPGAICRFRSFVRPSTCLRRCGQKDRCPGLCSQSMRISE